MTGTPDLSSFRRALEAFRATYAQEIFVDASEGKNKLSFSVLVSALTMRALQNEIVNYPNLLSAYRGEHGAAEWVASWHETIFNRLQPNEERKRKLLDYQKVASRWVAGSDFAHTVRDPVHGIDYLVEENSFTKIVVRQLARALRDWCQVHQYDSDFIKRPTSLGVFETVYQRGDLVAALRVAQILPQDVDRSYFDPGGRTAAQELTEFGINLCGPAGTVLALGEAYWGTDLFGHPLGKGERVALAALALLPFLIRFFRAGRAFYTTERLVRLYGADVRTWQRATTVAGRYANRVATLGKLRDGEQALAKGVDDFQRLAPEIVDAVAQESGGALVRTEAISVATQTFAILAPQSGVVVQLDALAVERLLAAAAAPLASAQTSNRLVAALNHVKGLLFEEMIETRIASWLSQPRWIMSLGLDAAEPVIFIPGRLIRDMSGRALTDGLLCVRRGNTLRVLAVLEAKSGKASAVGLSRASLNVTAKDRAEYAKLLRDEAGEFAWDQSRTARVTQTEFGGQVADDIERLDMIEVLHHDAGELATIRVGRGEAATVFKVDIDRMVPVFGFVPNDVNPAAIVRRLQAQKYNFYALPGGATKAELNQAAQAIVDIAQLLLP